jgi:hypothetical protein
MSVFKLVLRDGEDAVEGSFSFDPPVDLAAQERVHQGSGAKELGIAVVDYLRFRLGDGSFMEEKR